MFSATQLSLGALFACLVSSRAPAAGSDVVVTIDDPVASHVHPPGQTFEVTVTLSDPGVAGATLWATWVDPDGVPYGPPMQLAPGSAHQLTSPGTEVGYYGLVFHSDDPSIAFPPQDAGFASTEHGFVILPPRLLEERRIDPESFFGTVHTVLHDPYLAGGAKTLTWNTAGPNWWPQRIAEIRDNGLLELPLVEGQDWDSDDYQAIPQAQLDAMSARFREYLVAEPSVRIWELGLEENSGNTYAQPFYFQNLIAKTLALRAVADELDPGIRFVYNVHGFDYDELEDLFASGAMDHFQVFSIHPYRWTEFPSPETWFHDHVRWIRWIMRRYGNEMPLWITEFGLPVRGNNDPQGFFGYPSSGNQVPGATREHHARYLVKGHVMAAHARIEKLYLYNYQNRGNDIHYAEDHFGLRGWTPDRHTIPGHPLPAYGAYATMVRHLADRRPPLARRPAPDLFVYEFPPRFQDAEVDVLVVWAFPERGVLLPLDQLRAGLAAADVVEVVDMYGTPLALAGEAVRVSGRPLYVTVRRD